MIRLLLIAMMLCIATTGYAKKEEPTPAELAKTHGLVSVRVHYAGLPPGMVRPSSYGYEPLFGLQPVGDDTYKSIRWFSGRDPDDEVPGVWIPAGKHRFVSWRTSPWTSGPEIEVVAGRVLDLGDWLEVSLGGTEVVLSPFEHPALEGALDPWLDQHGDLLVERKPLVWRSTQVPAPITLTVGSSYRASEGGVISAGLVDNFESKFQEKLLMPRRQRLRAITDVIEFQREVLANLPPRNGTSLVDAEGRQYFGADFGRIRVREKDGSWNTLDTGAIGTVMTVYLHGDRLLAGTGEGSGEILERLADGDWKLVRKFASGESVEDIDHINGRWFVVTTRGSWPDFLDHLYLDKTTVQVGTADDFSDLSTVRQMEERQAPRMGWFPRGHLSNGDYYINSRSSLWRLELSSGQWTQLDVEAPSIVSVSPTTGAITVNQGFGLYPGVPRTGWTKMAASPKAKFKKVKWGRGLPYEAWLDNADTGWAVGSVKGPSLYDVWPTIIVRRIPGGIWEKVAEAPFGCWVVFRDGSGIPRYCTTELGTIMRRDEVTWAPEVVSN